MPLYEEVLSPLKTSGTVVIVCM